MNATKDISKPVKQATHLGVKPLFFQPKLIVNPPNDFYEQEADAVADKVMRMKEPVQQPAFFAPSPLYAQQKIKTQVNHEGNIQRQHDDEKTPQPKPPPPVFKPMIFWDDGEKKDLIPPSVLETDTKDEQAPGLSFDPRNFQLKTQLKPNFRDARLVLTTKGVLDTRDYVNDIGNLWQNTHQLVLDWRLGNIANNVLDKVPKFIKPDLEGLDMDTYITNKLVLTTLGSANTRDNPEFNEGSGIIIPLYSWKKRF